MGELDLESSIAAAWRRWQARLADHLAEMDADEVLVVVAVAGDQGREGPSVRFLVQGDGRVLRAEIGHDASRGVPPWIDSGRAAMLHRRGWRPHICSDAPDPGAVDPGAVDSGALNLRLRGYFLDLERDEADRLAFIAVQTLRAVLAVTHPAFLSAPALEADRDASPRASPPTANPAEPALDAVQPLAVVPETGQHLSDLVDDALVPMLGRAPRRDSDGDIPVPWGSTLVYIRVHDSAPVIELFSYVVEEVADLERATFEVAVLNRDIPFLKFLVVEDRVLASVHLPAWPFAPDHLRSTLAAMSLRLDEIDEDLVARIGGRLPWDDDPPRVPVDWLHPRVSDEEAMQTLLQLDAASGTRGVSPGLAARVCGQDQGLVLRLISRSEAQEEVWRAARDQARHALDMPEMERCAKEVSAWRRTTAVLRVALAIVVDASARPGDRAASGGSVGGASRPPGASRHGPQAAGAAEDV